MSENTRSMVSCEGMPFGSWRNWANQAWRFVAKVSISTQVLAPPMTPQMAMVTISIRRCSLRWSRKFRKCWQIASRPVLIVLLLGFRQGDLGGIIGATPCQRQWPGVKLSSLQCVRPDQGGAKKLDGLRFTFKAE